MRILLVDDRHDVRLPITLWLQEAGHEVIEAATYWTAIATLALPRRTDALMADIRLPDGSGLDLAAFARKVGIPALIFSGDPAAMDELGDQGTYYLCKPFRLEALTDWLAGINRGHG